MFGRLNLASILASAGLLAMAGNTPPAQPSIGNATPRRVSKTRGKGSINHAARAARSHAGKPAGYVKAY